LRVAFALALPILAYFNLKLEDLVSWGVILDLLGKFFANPYLVGLTIVNILTETVEMKIDKNARMTVLKSAVDKIEKK